MRLHVHLEGTSNVGKRWACLQKKKFFLKRKNDVWGGFPESIKILFIFWRVFGEFQCRKRALWKSCPTPHVWGSYGNCWIHFAEYLVHAWLDFVTKLQKLTPLFLPRLSNSNIIFSDNLITPTDKIKVYAPTDSELNLHKKRIENRHKAGINLGESI